MINSVLSLNTVLNWEETIYFRDFAKCERTNLTKLIVSFQLLAVNTFICQVCVDEIHIFTDLTIKVWQQYFYKIADCSLSSTIDSVRLHHY